MKGLCSSKQLGARLPCARIRLLDYRMRKMRMAEGMRGLTGVPQARARRAGRKLEALESCRTATWMQLGPPELGLLGHDLDMDPEPI